MKNLNIKVFTAFSGYDSQYMALDRLAENFLGFSYELVGWCEIDKYAIQAHNALYPQWADSNFGDISKIDWTKVPDFDLFTMSSPCQDFSCAGMQKGGAEGSGTRSSLLWECRKAILAKKPKYILFENVKNLVSKKFLPYFHKWQSELESYGYTCFAKVIDSQNFGIPQHRERLFMISILDENASYSFPAPFPLKKRLKDVLEENVDEKYYLSNVCINRLSKNLGGGKLEVDVNQSAKDDTCELLQDTDLRQLYQGRMSEINYKFYQYPRGVNKGGVLNIDICPTISCSSWENNCLLVESYMK